MTSTLDLTRQFVEDYRALRQAHDALREEFPTPEEVESLKQRLGEVQAKLQAAEDEKRVVLQEKAELLDRLTDAERTNRDVQELQDGLTRLEQELRTAREENETLRRRLEERPPPPVASDPESGKLREQLKSLREELTRCQEDLEQREIELKRTLETNDRLRQENNSLDGELFKCLRALKEGAA